MTKLDLNEVGFISGINSNFQAVEDELNNKILYRNNPTGEPNEMHNDLDMNGNHIYNLPAPVSPSEPARLQDVTNAISGANHANLIVSDPHGSVAATNVQAAINELADEKLGVSDGLTALNFLQGGTGANSYSAQDKMRQAVSVFDFMTGAQQTDVKNRTAALDVRTALQNAFNYVNSNGGGTLFFPPGKYRITGYVGTTFWDSLSIANNMNLHFDFGAEVFLDPNYAIPSGTWFWHAFSIEGNNNSITGSLKLRSNQTLVWNADLPSQRTNYLQGVIMGGKGYGHLPLALGQEREGVYMSGIDISDFHLPLVAEQASRVRIFNCKVANDTDTGILIENCLEDIEVAFNRLVNSGDDHFFARHYATTPWATASRYIGNVRFHNNYCENNFAKFGGFGGYSDVNCSNNYCRNSWFAGFNVEGDTTWYNNNHRIRFNNNIILEAGRAWDPAHPNPTYRVPVVDTSVTVGVLITGVNRAEFVSVTNNTIINPQSHAITVSNAYQTHVSGNMCTAGIVTKASVNYPTTGAALYIRDANRIGITGNMITPDQGGTAWPTCYDIGGDAITQRVKIQSNPIEESSSGLFVPYSAAMVQQVTYTGVNLSFTQNATPAIPTGGSSIVLSCPGAKVGDIVQISFSNSIAGATLTGFVNADDSVTARFENSTGGVINPGNGDFDMLLSRKGSS